MTGLPIQTEVTISSLSGTSATLVWTPTAATTGYKIGHDNTGAVDTSAPASATTHTFSGLSTCTTYTFYCEPQPSGTRKYITVTTDKTTPLETNLTVVNITDTTATLQWTAAAGATGYTVGRDGTDSHGNGPYETTVSAGTTSLSFTLLQPDTTYILYCAPQTGGERKYYTVRTRPAPPTSTTLVVTDVTDTTATLHWAAISGATGYTVGRDGTDSHGNGVFQTTDPAGATSRQFVWLNPSTTYTFSCQAQPSGQKLSVSITTAASPNDDFTLISMPDTQRDLWDPTHIQQNFDGRWQYIAANKDALNVKYVWQVGDLQDTDNLIFSTDTSVNPRYEPWNIDHYQYFYASQGLSILEAAGIPYTLVNGNHDCGAVCGGPACPLVAGQTQAIPIEVRNTRTWNMFYTPERYPNWHLYTPGKTDNHYVTFEAGGLKWLILSLELWARSPQIAWANDVFSKHPHHNLVLITHAYMNSDSSIMNSNGGYGTNTGQYVFDNLVKLHANMRFVFCGHVGNSGYRTDTGVSGNKIYSFLDCYHDTTNNWMRLLTVNVPQAKITTKVYAPITNATRSESTANVTITGIDWVT